MVLEESDLIGVRLDASRLIRGGPYASGLLVAKENVRTPAILVISSRQRVMAMSRQRLYPEPADVSINPVAAVGKELRARSGVREES